MTSTEDSNPSLELEEKRYEFSGHLLKISTFRGTYLGVSAFVWEPGLVLCRYFENENIDFTGKKVLELGSGTGIVGILAVLLGGDVTLTDKAYVLKQIEYNVVANIPTTSRHRSKVRALAWGNDQGNFSSDFDFILGSDIVYNPPHFPGLLQTLLHLCNTKTTVYMSSNLKAREGAVNFHEELLPKQFNSELIHTSGNNYIYKVTKKAPHDEH
ncbi:EEF1A lysine methyltransferase 3-like [Carcharodon carcharias]|uniref:EEF1A lysine methyltransferase 3-like n=1 Tax=Carcharodon carcharias TaxID=13397 RepID=UPI001B7ECD8A|nr:EEF1A lysine methyltransferase 3-like [Carcharodon carcharias]